MSRSGTNCIGTTWTWRSLPAAVVMGGRDNRPAMTRLKKVVEPRYSTYSAGPILALRAARRVESRFLDWRFDRATH